MFTSSVKEDTVIDNSMSPVTKRCAIAFGYLLHLVVVSQHKKCLLKFAHSLHFGHYILVDPIHDFLNTSGT